MNEKLYFQAEDIWIFSDNFLTTNCIKEGSLEKILKVFEDEEIH